MIPSKEEIPKHRPLWLSELRKEVPAGAQYDIDSSFGSKKTLFKTRAATFKNNYGKYGHTCDIQKDIQIFQRNADQDQRGVASYDIDAGMTATKKKNPVYSQSKAKQFELWTKGRYLSVVSFWQTRLSNLTFYNLCRDEAQRSDPCSEQL